MALLEVRDINKSFGRTKVLKGISFDLNEGNVLSIIGSSGSGKTTLLNVIGGLDVYDSGDLIIKGKSTKSFKTSDWDAVDARVI